MKGAYGTKSSTVGGGSEGEGGETREITLVLQEIHLLLPSVGIVLPSQTPTIKDTLAAYFKTKERWI